MTTPVENQSPRERSWIYFTVCVILGVMALWAIFAFSSARETKRAEDKADELIAALQDAGVRTTPDKDQIVRVLGDDGGATCSNPNKALSRATLFTLLANGATGPGARPVIADSRAVKGQLLIIQIYCPDELADFQQFVDDLKTDDVASD
jgi:Tfp pilus assembly protein FimT